MNFFGHAAVASWSAGGDARVVLGAMLPDLASMLGARLQPATETDAEGEAEAAGEADRRAIERGVAMHYRADSVFHALPPVTGLMRELGAALDAGGCARGPARAVAHVGTELLLDGALAGEPAYRDAYLAALAVDPRPARWTDPLASERLVALVARLRMHGVPSDLRDPDAVTSRLGRILGGRPRLAPDAEDLRVIRRAIAAHVQRVEVAAEAVMRGMRAGLT